MTDNLTLFELQKIHETLTKTKEEHIFNQQKPLTLVNLYLTRQKNF